MVKSGNDHIRSLDDDRSLYIYGKQVQDIVSDPAFAGTTKSYAALYDYQSDPANIDRMTFVSPTSGEQVNRLWQLPKNYQELVSRRRALSEWAELSCGMLGRSPDHVGSSLAGMYMGLDVFEEDNPKRASALRDYYHFARDNDLFLTYVIINPQADRSKATSDQPGEDLVARVVDEDNEGITIRGAKMLGTSVPFANEVLVSGFMGLQPGEEDFAFTAVVPIGAKGLKVFSRRSYEANTTSTFDNPLSSRFDENDAVLYFEDVKIPWDRVFVYRDVKMAQAQWHQTRAHVFQNYQCQIRLSVKLKFLVGLTRKIAETNGIINIPSVREDLGLLASQARMIEGLVHAMEADGERYKGYYVPNRSTLATSQVIAQNLYPEIVTLIRKLAGGGLIMLPSEAADFHQPEFRSVIEKTQRSSVTDSLDRVKLFNLAWDAIGSEFASRHTQYEMFYSGPSFVTRGHSYRLYDWDGSKQMVDDLMASYDLPPKNSPTK
ncbi:4-hydroxyphenylacetate 3-hydroxylase family protein [Sneathiella aquimaris]|uniref:4-hydroxyphenylacetate 3-hydroxylase family protein n=1 Tax=Sneathiella aquimaris TaxID=2599305 RepID=UPI00146EF529|nr:4-hydroxyphenylacetate 3-hydroxylase N-terminal domain-containing protein [Sneathiella aquimaris]